MALMRDNGFQAAVHRAIAAAHLHRRKFVVAGVQVSGRWEYRTFWSDDPTLVRVKLRRKGLL